MQVVLLYCCTAVTAMQPSATAVAAAEASLGGAATTAAARTQSLPAARVSSTRFAAGGRPSCTAVRWLIRAGPARNELSKVWCRTVGGLQLGGVAAVAAGSGRRRAAAAAAAAAHLGRRGDPPPAAESLANHLVPAVRHLAVSGARKTSDGHKGMSLLGGRSSSHAQGGMLRHTSTTTVRFGFDARLPSGRSRWRHRAATLPAHTSPWGHWQPALRPYKQGDPESGSIGHWQQLQAPYNRKRCGVHSGATDQPEQSGEYEGHRSRGQEKGQYAQQASLQMFKQYFLT
jgi:hypothetical protein